MASATQTEKSNATADRLVRPLRFGDGVAEGRASDLGRKGRRFALLAAAGAPVAAGFTLAPAVAESYRSAGCLFHDAIESAIHDGVATLETLTGRKYGETAREPLLLSVRSSGKLPAITNLGLSHHAAKSISENADLELFVWDSYQRLIKGLSLLGLGLSANRFEDELRSLKRSRGLLNDLELTDDDWKEVVVRYHQIYQDAVGSAFPQDAMTQLLLAVGSVFESDPESAVHVQVMACGNRNADSAVGVYHDGGLQLRVNAQGYDLQQPNRGPAVDAIDWLEARGFFESDLRRWAAVQPHDVLNFAVEDKRLFIV